MKWIIDIPESTITDLKKKQGRTEVDIAVLNGSPINECFDKDIPTITITVEEYLELLKANDKTAPENIAETAAEKKRFITADEAIALLPEGEYIHTFRQSGVLIGADWLREEVIDLIKKSDCLELTGGMARSLDHGLAIYDYDAKLMSDILFVETDMEKLQALDPDEEVADE